MSNSSSSAVNVLEITRSLPLEVRCLVLKHAILRSIRPLYTWGWKDELYPYQIFNLIGYNPILDDIMALVLQELSFDVYILNHDCFNDIAEFIISRSISMKHLCINDYISSAKVVHTPNLLGFIESFQEVTVHRISYILKEEFQMTFFKCVTSLTISTEELYSQGGGFENFTRLVNLELQNGELRSINCKVEKYVTDWMVSNSRLSLNLELSIFLKPEHINFVKKLVEKWRAYSSGVPKDRKNQISLKLSFSACYGDEEEYQRKSITFRFRDIFKVGELL
ncbi:unnamed protein product [Ambrosiozyma monospora]|uniref:Unnamed protein product n=1 Tax=Ambrosiozyma monospora TaxID=43982 RepID=A0ACB5U7B4_AMBMO|nr:unnamed protein product [Ambrosiozyma monospora]